MNESDYIPAPGHRYALAGGQTLQFLDKRPDGPGPLVTVMDGTTNEEVLTAVLDRLKILNQQYPCRENALAITNIQQGLMWLEERTKERQSRGVEGMAAK